MERFFIITIDTEGDNLWKWKEGTPIRTENSSFIPRFQELCEKYRFIPTYLCNWEMANDDRFACFARRKMEEKKCEIGMHLHAWNTPPFFDLPKHEHARKPYLIEYPEQIMEQKIISMTRLLEEKFGKKPVVHRAGRWAMDERYFRLLHKHGYIADCSVTPGVNWDNNWGMTPGFHGSDYSKCSIRPQMIHGVLEVPVSIIKGKNYNNPIWLRPKRENLSEMLHIVNSRKKTKIDCLEFIIHSSELMPGGSPTFCDNDSIEKLYDDLGRLFGKIAMDYSGVGLEEYAKKCMETML